MGWNHGLLSHIGGGQYFQWRTLLPARPSCVRTPGEFRGHAMLLDVHSTSQNYWQNGDLLSRGRTERCVQPSLSSESVNNIKWRCISIKASHFKTGHEFVLRIIEVDNKVVPSKLCVADRFSGTKDRQSNADNMPMAWLNHGRSNYCPSWAPRLTDWITEWIEWMLTTQLRNPVGFDHTTWLSAVQHDTTGTWMLPMISPALLFSRFWSPGWRLLQISHQLYGKCLLDRES